MRQIIMTGPGTSKVIDVSIPEINDDEILVKVSLSGVCHSEYYPWLRAKDGDVLGHESIGTVAKLGKNVTGFKIGDRVSGLGGGAFKEYIVMEPRKCFHVPDSLKDEDAITEPLACQLSAAMKLPIKTLGDSIAVVGCGYMGLGVISLFKAMGYGQIVAVDKRREALANAVKFGATEIYTPEELPGDYLLNYETMGQIDLTRDSDNEILFSKGFDTVMEFAGTEDGLQLAGDMVRAHGRLGIGGYHNDAMRSIDYQLWNFKAITTINCHERRVVYEAGLCKRCLELLDSGIWKFSGVTRVYEMDEFDQANRDLDSHKDNYIKGAIRC